LPLKNRRTEYSWPPTVAEKAALTSDKKTYGLSDSVKISTGFRILGGLREAFHPDVWTVAWEDFDKIVRLSFKMEIGVQRGVTSRKVAGTKKELRKSSFYWSRDPDLPYRIWAMIMPEDGGPPIIPRDVEDARAKMLDFQKDFVIPADDLGAGRHKLISNAGALWWRKSFIEKGKVKTKSDPLVIEIER
jgi:hypothetical protein